MFIRALAAAALLAASTAGQAQRSQGPLDPTEKWVAEYANDMCLLQRSYGTKDHPLALAFRPSPMTDYLTAWVFDGKDASPSGYTQVRIDVGDGSPPEERSMAVFFARRLNLRVNEFGVARAELDKAAKSGAISLESKGHLALSLRVPKLQEALAVLDDCVSGLVETWGFSREQQKEIEQPAKIIGSPNKYVSGWDYPMQALREDQSGENSARFIIRADGTTSDCKIVESSNSHSLDSQLCIVIRRMRYKPALNHSGIPVESMSFQRIRWQLF